MCMSLDLLTSLRPDTESTRPTTLLARVSGTGHVTSTVTQLRGVDCRATETLTRVFGSCDRISTAVTEGDTSIVGHMCAVEG